MNLLITFEAPAEYRGFLFYRAGIIRLSHKVPTSSGKHFEGFTRQGFIPALALPV